MHDTALKHGRIYFEVYARTPAPVILDNGAMNVNGSLRDVAPPGAFYIGADLERGNGVDLVKSINQPMPLRDESIDMIVSSSQMEHDDFFWVTFLDFCRLLKPGGTVYLNVPSNGSYHRYPNDNWRFYPDAGLVLARWGRQCGHAVELIESFIGKRETAVWSDFVAVFAKAPIGAPPARAICDIVPCTNVWRYGALELDRYARATEDMLAIKRLTRENDELKAEIRTLRDRLSAR